MICTLTCATSPTIAFTSVTNTDGRIANWESELPASGTPHSIASLIKEQAEKVGGGIVEKGASVWQIRFNTGAYYGVGKTFWPVVELTFFVKEGEHFHVPLLIGPYSYTTYRGS